MAPKRKSAFASQQVAKVPKKTLNASATRRMSAAQSQAVNDSSDEDVNDSPDEDAVQNPATRVLRPRVNGKAQVATSASKTFRDIAQEMGGPIMPGTSFKNMQLLPAELQIQIWKDAQRSSPAVHFCVARAIENIDYYDNLHNTKTCSLELSPAQKITDDSAWRINTPLSHICSAALRASFIRPEHEALLRLTQGTHRIAGHTDLLCLKMNFGIPDGKPHHVWPRGNNFSLHDGSIDHDAVKQQLKGFHKIGLWNEPDDPWRKFTCLTMQFAIGAVCGHRLFPEAICPIQLAGFIDSCPDIEEFYLVVPKYGVTPTSKSRKAKEARTWSASRDPSLRKFIGKKNSYVEVHNPFLHLANFTLQRNTVFPGTIKSCDCPLAPGCYELPFDYTRVEELFMPLMEAKIILTTWHTTPSVFTFNWNLTKAHRERIKFKVLIEDIYG